MTTININLGTRTKLINLKKHNREPYEEVIIRLVDYYEQNNKQDNELQ